MLSPRNYNNLLIYLKKDKFLYLYLCKIMPMLTEVLGLSLEVCPQSKAFPCALLCCQPSRNY